MAFQYSFYISKKENNYYIHNENFGNIHLIKKERFPKKETAKTKGGYETPMPSAIVKILVEVGQEVNAGDGLVVLSSMKMENTVCAGEDGTVEEIYVEERGECRGGGFIAENIGGRDHPPYPLKGGQTRSLILLLE